MEMEKFPFHDRLHVIKKKITVVHKDMQQLISNWSITQKVFDVFATVSVTSVYICLVDRHLQDKTAEGELPSTDKTRCWGKHNRPNGGSKMLLS